MLVCVSHGYPLPTDWNWYKEEEDGSRDVRLTKCSVSSLSVGTWTYIKLIAHYHGNRVLVASFTHLLLNP